jgi:hypothetical protein
MKLEEMVPNKYYRLTKEIHNPNIDRRCKSDWTRKETFPKGLLVYTTNHRGLDSPAGKNHYLASGFGGILDNLEETPITLDEILLQADGNCADYNKASILEALFEAGTVNEALIRAVIAQINEKYDYSDKNMEKTTL